MARVGDEGTTGRDRVHIRLLRKLAGQGWRDEGGAATYRDIVGGMPSQLPGRSSCLAWLAKTDGLHRGNECWHRLSERYLLSVSLRIYIIRLGTSSGLYTSARFLSCAFRDRAQGPTSFSDD